ncbi:uncharacterized protein LOC116251422 [Nymphaea colorata]|nr:uncharacterized protein LOC116251422 [Nymphaea colorata]XP_031481544.1 uncharacterized protein LOC116251422 [Nymphaea colorata]XP_031481545.1 uncharacterized protein LOC116251422 [Nymphaea colorata]XP_031481546.1 uncharacterized protein LOC116251422 [Nymphaea colorata]XP_031481547.1 uncharacterized protein LOC116251422 [Nymphaea colorata]XP_031481548.1 uncharacterized protein LOC116251422 [Nymphaea colorata]XP_031481549.1 uncharacterized protein LOC116251422 [Nymphaea colorata]XP_03148155
MDADPEDDGESAGVVLDVSLRKRQKTREIAPSKTPSRKGKEKVEMGEDDPGASLLCICGICLSEDGKANRGVIDCCNHYFCFVCIMEWAKVESRCPMCKQRFTSIWRPTKSGSCLQERLVYVPVRDQASQNEAQSVDLYANIHCTICKLSDNDSVLLLCDLCDSAAHTYCVGLGNTVPEGDWYCNDCMISKNEHSNPDIQCDSLVENLSADVEAVAADEKDDLIFEIVKDEPCLLERSSSPSAQRDHTESCKDEPSSPEGSSHQTAKSNHSGSCRTSRRKNTRKLLRDASCPQKSTSQMVVADLKSVLPSARPRTFDHRARTLSCCRRLHQRIKALRENWNALQTGSLSFSRCFDSRSAGNIGRRQKAPPNICKGLRKEVNPISAQNVASNVKIPCCKATSGSGYDADRAWKMMAMAKTLSCGPPSNGANSSEGSKSVVTREKPVACNMISTVENETLSVDVNAKRCITKNSGSKKCIVNRNSYVNKDVFGSCSNLSIGYCDPSNSHIPVAPTGSMGNLDKYSFTWLHDKKLSNVHIDRLNYDNQSTFVSSPCHAEHKAEPSSVGKVEPSDSAKALRASQVKDESAAKRYETDKHQIQSLVKLNLKLLTRGKQLGVDRFKEVGRIATHTVLAACGLEHSKSIVRPFSKLHCSHALRLEATSSLMPDCCRECFSFFIQDVVRTILSEKV